MADTRALAAREALAVALYALDGLGYAVKETIAGRWKAESDSLRGAYGRQAETLAAALAVVEAPEALGDIRCSFGCHPEKGNPVVALIALTEGCAAFPNARQQLVCMHHWQRCEPIAGMETLWCDPAVAALYRAAPAQPLVSRTAIELLREWQGGGDYANGFNAAIDNVLTLYGVRPTPAPAVQREPDAHINLARLCNLWMEKHTDEFSPYDAFAAGYRAALTQKGR